MYRYFATLDACITDACVFLRIDRGEFFELAESWRTYSDRFAEFARPEDFYLAFTGEMGAANLCANILRQYMRTDLYAHLQRMTRVRDNLIVADIGCGSGSLSYPMLDWLGQAYFVDVPNLAQEFLAWRCKRNKRNNSWVGGLEEMPEKVEAIICIDVLEHIASSSAFFRKMDERLLPNGLLFLQAPWASVCPNPEHLPEAEADWHAGGGAELLASAYAQIYPFDAGGLYQKRLLTG